MLSDGAHLTSFGIEFQTDVSFLTMISANAFYLHALSWFIDI